MSGWRCPECHAALAHCRGHEWLDEDEAPTGVIRVVAFVLGCAGTMLALLAVGYWAR